MQYLKSHLRELKPAFVLIYLSLMGFLSIYSVQKYLGFGFEPINCITFMGIIFGVYTLNRFTDTAEDFTNDIARLLFFQRKKSFQFLAAGVLAGSIGILLFLGKLNWMHILLLGMGFGYSYRLVPWYSRGRGFHLLRLKEMTLIKNIAVSFLWSASVFVVPILYSGATGYDSLTIWLLAMGLFVSTLNNTLFDDIMDEAGDRIAGIKTLPTVLGSRNSNILLLVFDAAWLLSVSVLWGMGCIGGGHAAFLAFLGLYPLVYISLYARKAASKEFIDFLSETDLLFFALGMFLLSAR